MTRELAPWTADCIADRLVEAFRAMPTHPVFSAGGRFHVRGMPDAGEALGWPKLYVSDQHARVVLMTWARCRATGESVRARYAGLGWQRDTAERQRRAALTLIAAGLNRENMATEGLTMQSSDPEPQKQTTGDPGLVRHQSRQNEFGRPV